MAVVTVTKDTFEAEVMQSDKTVLIDFWAAWCGPCRMQGPVIDQVAEANPGVKVVKINVDEERELAQRFSIMTIPTLMIVKDGKVIEQVAGLRSKADLERMLAQ